MADKYTHAQSHAPKMWLTSVHAQKHMCAGCGWLFAVPLLGQCICGRCAERLLLWLACWGLRHA
eukprot:scaffold65460_cov19-Tisochrysis_lutea.AAC.1